MDPRFDPTIGNRVNKVSLQKVIIQFSNHVPGKDVDDFRAKFDVRQQVGQDMPLAGGYKAPGLFFKPLEEVHRGIPGHAL